MLPGLRSLVAAQQIRGPKWNPLDKAAAVTLSADNTVMSASAAIACVRNDKSVALAASDGQLFYIEAKVLYAAVVAQFGPATGSHSLTSNLSTGTNAAAYNFVGGSIAFNGTSVTSGKPTFGPGDIIGMSIRRPASGLSVVWYKNGVACDVERTFAITNPTNMFFAGCLANSGGTANVSLEIMPQPVFPMPAGASYWSSL